MLLKQDVERTRRMQREARQRFRQRAREARVTLHKEALAARHNALCKQYMASLPLPSFDRSRRTADGTRC